MVLRSMDEVCGFSLDTLAKHPERNQQAAYEAASKGRIRPHAAITINHLNSPEDVFAPPLEFELPEVDFAGDSLSGLARELLGKLEPLKMLNPVKISFGLGAGTGTFATCFGIPLNPEADNSPAYTMPIENFLQMPEPDPCSAGLLEGIKKRIRQIKDNCPSAIKISLPDMQGPFNIAHAIAGNEALMGPYTNPEKFWAFMAKITNFWVKARRVIIDWIGEEYLDPVDRHARIAECSVNLVSAAMYEKFILPHDKRIADEFGPLIIHPCSGPHVFHETLNNLPVFSTEAGKIAKSASGSISVQEALSAIGRKPVLLSVGQELPQGSEYEFIKKDIDFYASNKRLLFAYTGIHWRKKDRPAIRELHLKLDEYWDNICK